MVDDCLLLKKKNSCIIFMVQNDFIWDHLVLFLYKIFLSLLNLLLINKNEFRVLQILEMVSSRYIEISNKINQKKKGRKNSALKRNKVRLNLSSFGQKESQKRFFLNIALQSVLSLILTDAISQTNLSDYSPMWIGGIRFVSLCRRKW